MSLLSLTPLANWLEQSISILKWNFHLINRSLAFRLWCPVLPSWSKGSSWCCAWCCWWCFFRLSFRMTIIFRVFCWLQAFYFAWTPHLPPPITKFTPTLLEHTTNENDVMSASIHHQIIQGLVTRISCSCAFVCPCWSVGTSWLSFVHILSSIDLLFNKPEGAPFLKSCLVYFSFEILGDAIFQASVIAVFWFTMSL